MHAVVSYIICLSLCGIGYCRCVLTLLSSLQKNSLLDIYLGLWTTIVEADVVGGNYDDEKEP